MKKMNVNKEQVSMSELEQVNGGILLSKHLLPKSVSAWNSKL
jgi:hypothetical protein